MKVAVSVITMSVQEYSRSRMYTFGIIILFSVQFFCNLATQQEVKCSGHICIPTNYENFNPPFHKEILNISVNFQGIWIRKVDDIEHTISLSLDIWMTWEEPRLELNANLQENKSHAMDKSFLNLLWLPDIFIYDAKKVVKNRVVGDFESLSYQPILKLHFLRYTVSLNVEIVCHHLKFDDYPFDTHECTFEMGSYTYPKEELIFTQMIEGNYINKKGFVCSDFLIDVEKMPKERNESKSGYSITGFKMTTKKY